jgi:hypothetical protein
MQILLLIFTGLFGLALAFYNAWAFAMATCRDKYFNRLVHRTGGTIRLLWIIFVIASGITLNLNAENIVFDVIWCGFWFFPVYNVLYNQLNGEGWFYFGTKDSKTSSILDKWFGKLYLPAYIIILLLLILWYPLGLYKFITQILIESFKDRWIDWCILLMIIIAVFFVLKKFHNKKV